MSKIVRYEVDLNLLPPLTDAQKAELKALSERPDSEIDRALHALPGMSSCRELENAANRQSHAILDRHVARERQYDIDTGFGNTQGAWLPR
jgi:predicted secreted Zn-dependent protease